MFGMLSVRWNPSYLIFWVLRKILHSGWALICLYWRVIILCNTTQYRFELEPNNTTFSLVTRSVTFCHQVVNKLPIWNCWIAFYLKQPPCTIDKLQSCLLQLENMSFFAPIGKHEFSTPSSGLSVSAISNYQCQKFPLLLLWLLFSIGLQGDKLWLKRIYHQNQNTRGCWKERKWRGSTQVLYSIPAQGVTLPSSISPQNASKYCWENDLSVLEICQQPWWLLPRQTISFPVLGNYDQKAS